MNAIRKNIPLDTREMGVMDAVLVDTSILINIKMQYRDS